MLHLVSDDDGNDNTLPFPISYYAEQGWKLIPCHGVAATGCLCGKSHQGSSDAGKHPALLDWPSRATSEKEQLLKWFGNGSLNNVGVVCRQSGLVVIDVDPRNGGDESFLQLESLLGGAIPTTVTALTGQYLVKGKNVRGRHFYFKTDPNINFIKDFSRLGLKGIDIKSNGYVMLPPSSHISGLKYEWEEGLSPFDTVISELSPQMQSIMVKGITNPTSSTSQVNFDFDQYKNVIATSSAKRELAKQVDRIKSKTFVGQRNIALNEAAFVLGQFIGGGQISVEEATEALTEAARYAFSGEDAEIEIASVLRLKGGGFEAGTSSPIYDVKFDSPADLGSLSSNLDDENFLAKMHLVDWQELWADLTEEVWHVDGIICQARGHVVYSSPGVGKSLLVREICACLATGKSVLGLPPKEPIRVLYIDHENIPTTDIKRSLIDMGFDWKELEPNFKLLSFPEFAPFDLPRGGQELKRVLEILKPQLVIIDTASRTIQGKENDNDTWIDFYNYTGKILKAMNIAYIRIDHTGKNADAGPRGGSAKMGDVDLVWYMKEVETDSKYRLINEKHRVPLENLEFGISRTLEPLRHLLTGGPDWHELVNRVERHEKMILEIEKFIASNPKHQTGLTKLYGSMKSICKEHGFSRRNFDAARIAYLEEHREIEE